MSIFLKNTDNTENPCPDSLHYIPAKTNKDSVADVGMYFEQFTEEVAETGDTKILTNSLRGRPLTGAKLTLPDGWLGVVYGERKRPLNDDTDRVFQQKTTFDQFTYWNYDKNPSRNDAFAQAQQWLEISDVLHAPEK